LNLDNTEANDKKFIDEYVAYREHAEIGRHEEYTIELLRIYLNVLYDKNDKINSSGNGYIWIRHTRDILQKAGENIKFLNNRKFDPIIFGFNPTNNINVLMMQDNLPKMMSLDRSDTFFTRFITININIDIKKHKAQEKIEDEVDDEIKYDPKIRIDYKVRTALLILLLKKINITRNEKDVTKICRLISMLTGQSFNSLYQDLIAGIQLMDKNKKSITEMNSILNDLDIDFKLMKGEEYKLWKDKIK